MFGNYLCATISSVDSVDVYYMYRGIILKTHRYGQNRITHAQLTHT